MNGFHVWYADERLIIRYVFLVCCDVKSALTEKIGKYNSIVQVTVA